MLRKKRSQIAFILLVVVILVVIFIIIYTIFRGEAVRRVEFEVAEKVVKDATPIKEFVQQCFEEVSKEGLILVGKQGGRIFKSQQGPITDFLKQEPFSVSYLGDYVRTAELLSQASRGRILASFNGYTYYSNPDKYPWKNFPYKDDEIPDINSEKSYNGIFSDSSYNLPPLIDGIEEGKAGMSVKEMLEFFLNNKVREECSNEPANPGKRNFQVFEEQGFIIETGKSNTNVTITNENVNVHLKMPVSVKTGEDDTKTFEDFNTNFNVRLKKIFSMAQTRLDNDRLNINYDIKKNWISTSGSYKVKSTEHAGSEGRYTIVSIEDVNSRINNKPYKFQFARKNRPPALEYILDNCIGIKGISENEIRRDKVVPAALEIFDPDEDVTSLTANEKNGLKWPLRKNPAVVVVKADDGEIKDTQEIKIMEICP